MSKKTHTVKSGDQSYENIKIREILTTIDMQLLLLYDLQKDYPDDRVVAELIKRFGPPQN